MSNPTDVSRFPTLASIEEKKFRLGLKGYNVNEVDKFLSALLVEVRALRSALEAAETEVSRLRGSESTPES